MAATRDSGERRPGFQPDPDRAFAIAQELFSIPSFKGEEAALSDWATGFLADLGFETEQQHIHPGQSQTIAGSAGQGSRPNVLLNGHLDIDPLRANWTQDPFTARREDNLLIGAGARNMQGGLVSILLAAEALISERDRADVTIALVAGELQGGIGTTHALAQGLTADLAIVPEPFGVDNLVTDTWGVIEFAVVFEGLSAHVSKLHLARDPLPAAIRLRERLQQEMELRSTEHGDDLLFNIGGLIAGRGDTYSLNAANYSPDRCALLIDVRHSERLHADEVMELFRGLVQEVDGRSPETGVAATLQFGSTETYRLNEIPFPAYSAHLAPGLHDFLSDARIEALGEPFARAGTVFPHSYCGADTSHLGIAGIPSVLVGPTGPLPQPGIGDDAVYLDEVLDTARFLHRVVVDIEWRNLQGEK